MSDHCSNETDPLGRCAAVAAASQSGEALVRSCISRAVVGAQARLRLRLGLKVKQASAAIPSFLWTGSCNEMHGVGVRREPCRVGQWSAGSLADQASRVMACFAAHVCPASRMRMSVIGSFSVGNICAQLSATVVSDVGLAPSLPARLPCRNGGCRSARRSKDGPR